MAKADRIKSHLLVSAIAVTVSLYATAAQADPVKCDLSAYKATPGLAARQDGNSLFVTWSGDSNQEVRLRLAVVGGKPIIEELALRHGGATWSTLARNATPDYEVMTGLRRMSSQQLEPLRGLGVEITQAVVNKYRWDPFWDAPFDLSVPAGGRGGNPPPAAGLPGTDQPGLPRKPEEIQRASAVYQVTGCTVKTDGGRLEINYPGVKLGVFDGSLQYTAYKGTNLILQEVIGSTQEPWVAYKYSAGLKGIAIQGDSRVVWRDTANTWKDYTLGAEPDKDEVALQASNRLVIAEQGKAGSIAAFPPPHKFFWSREVATNMGYDYYRKESDTSYSIGVRQSDHEDLSQGQGNWALYSARPGTSQLMSVYLYPALAPAQETAVRVLAFTHDDHYKPIPGYQVMQHHYHMDLGERLLRSGSLDTKIPDLAAIKSLGINIVSQIDSVMLRGFSATGTATAQPPRASAAGAGETGAAPRRAAGRGPGGPGGPRGPGGPGTPAGTAGPARRRAAEADQVTTTAASVEGARINSSKGFLVLADQEVFGSPLGGHTDLLFSHPVYWDQRTPGQPFEEESAKYGKIYHIGDAVDFMKMVDAEDVMISMPHPRTKGSTGFPDAIKDRDYFNDPRYQGFGLRWGMGLDGSERRTCEYRCLPLLDDMSNWVVDRPEPLKYAISISEVRHQQPGDDIYAGSPVTYVHLKDLPPPTDPKPVIDALMKGDMFITTGEVLVPTFSVKGTGATRTIVADVEWTFPLDMVEVIWGDGKTTGRKIISTTDLPPFGSHHFEIPFDAQGQKWVRFAAWDSAYEGAILEPQRLGPMPAK
jgi:hypothetical protein